MAIAWSMLMEPLRACAPRSAKSIQPALNPSIICMRGVGFFMPWARKIDSHRLRGTASARTGVPNTLANAAARSFGETRCRRLVQSGRLVELFPEWSDERFPLYAIYPSRLHRAAKVRAFIEFCLEIITS